MGLAKAVAVRFPDWGPDFVFLMVRPSYAPAMLHLQIAVPPCVLHLDHTHHLTVQFSYVLCLCRCQSL